MDDVIKDKLEAAFAPARLDVINQSHLHAGHAGSPGTGDSHFLVVIESAAFVGMTRVAMQRAVMSTLKAELDGPVHALAIKAKAVTAET